MRTTSPMPVAQQVATSTASMVETSDRAAGAYTDAPNSLGWHLPMVPCSLPRAPEAVSETARWAAGTRFLASQNCPLQFGDCDPYAGAFAGSQGLALARAYDAIKRPEFVAVNRSTEGHSMYYAASRSLTFDQAITRVMAEPQGPRQAVVLGAGLDSRAWRLDFPPDLAWIELDSSAEFAQKATRTADRPRCAQTFAQVDLADPDWALRALPAGFSHDPTLWIAEGLAYYLTPGDLASLVRTVTDMSAPGSTWLFDAHDLSDPRVHAGTVALNVFSKFWEPRGVRYRSASRHIMDPLRSMGWTVGEVAGRMGSVTIQQATLVQKAAAHGLPDAAGALV